MQLLHRGQVLPDLPWVAASVWLGLYPARMAVELQQTLDKAEAHAKHPGELPLGTFPSLVGVHDLQPKVR